MSAAHIITVLKRRP